MRIFRRSPDPAQPADSLQTLLGQPATPALAGTGTGVAPPKPSRPTEAPVGDRLERLAGGVDGSRRRRGTAKDVRKLMHLIGMVAVGCGIAAVILGWYGASHSPFLYQEVPYLISGGLLGLALVFAGGSIYLGSWALRQIQENHRDTQAVVRSIERLERTLRAQSAVPMDRPEGEPAMANGNGHGTDERNVGGR